MLGPFLVAARTRRFLSQKDVARRAGIAPSYLSQIECRGQIPSREVLQALARALDLHPDMLIVLLYPTEELACPHRT